MSPNEMPGGLFQDGMRQLGEMLAKDPILRAAEEALNANPFREVVPVAPSTCHRWKRGRRVGSSRGRR
jgi:hypothetical protein